MHNKYFWKSYYRSLFVFHIFTLLLAYFASKLVNYSRHSDPLNIRRTFSFDSSDLSISKHSTLKTHCASNSCSCLETSFLFKVIAFCFWILWWRIIMINDLPWHNSFAVTCILMSTCVYLEYIDNLRDHFKGREQQSIVAVVYSLIIHVLQKDSYSSNL